MSKLSLPFKTFCFISALSSCLIAHSGEPYNGWVFSYDSETHEAFLIADNSFSGDIVVPETVISEYDGDTYTVVGALGFEYNPDITSVTLPATIMNSANFMGCTGLKSVIYKAPFTKIDEKTFYECISLENVDMPPTVTTIGEEAFYGCSSLRIVNWPAELRKIEKAAFQNCTSFITETLPSNLYKIGEWAFAGCTSLTNVIVPSSVEIIHPYAYSGCVALVSCHVNESTKTLKLYASYSTPFEESALRHLYIGRKWILKGYDGIGDDDDDDDDDTVSIGPAFGTNLTDVEVRGDVTSIPRFAFFECGDLERVIISEPVEKIERDAFGFCYNLTNIDLPSSLKTIGDYAFESCGLQSITLPPKANDLGEYIFSGCVNMESANLGDALTDIPFGMFDFCTQLKNVTWSDHLKSIDHLAFSSTALESVVIPETVTYIGASVFQNCENLKSVQLPSQIDEIYGSLFNGCINLASIDLPKNIKRIDGSAFASCSKLTEIIIPEGVTSIGQAAFMYTPLQEIRLPDSVTEIGALAFASTKIRTATFGKNIQSIGQMPFYYSSLAKAIWLGQTPPEGIENVTAGAQYTLSTNFPENCMVYPLLEDRFVVDGIVYVPVGQDSEYVDIIDCSYLDNLTSVDIPQTVKSGTTDYKVRNINPYAFYNNETLTTATLNHVQTIGDYSFGHCSNIVNAVVGNTAETLCEGAFYGIISMQEVTLGAGLKTIEAETFASNWFLNKIISKATVPPTCLAEVFDSTDYNTCQLIVPANSLNDYKTAFQWKEFTNIIGENFNDGVNDTIFGENSLSQDSFVEIYDITGRLIYQGVLRDYRDNTPSIKIVKAGSSTYKRFI